MRHVIWGILVCVLFCESVLADAYEQARLEAARANALSELERYEEAAEAFLSAGRIAERLGWLSMAAGAYRVSGEAAYHGSNRAAMLTAWESRLGVEQGRENDEGVAWVLWGLPD